MADRVHIPGSQELVLSCPACWSWQLHVDIPARIADGTFANLSEAEAIIESLLREHVGRECTHPRLILELLRNRGIRQ